MYLWTSPSLPDRTDQSSDFQVLPEFLPRGLYQKLHEMDKISIIYMVALGYFLTGQYGQVGQVAREIFIMAFLIKCVMLSDGTFNYFLQLF